MERIKEARNIIYLTVVYLLVVTVFYFLKIPCLFKHFIGIDCLGCGMSRAIFSVLKLDFRAAFSYHPMFWSMPILYLQLLFGGKLFNKKIIDYGTLIFIALGFIINWISKIV